MASTPEIEADKATRKAYRALLNHERKEKELLKMVPDDQHYKLTLQNKAGNTILHEASTSNKLVLTAEEMLNKAPELLNMHNNFGVTPLYRSVEFGRMKMFKFLDNRIRQ
ncbi:hypothetical protein Vadar_014822 [Vaccinium darrowii]|uniref:Uncharacterized protein n=1 Tax=Vaccinium darrowii TaxID=229202 RepID=A0ACB7Z5E8_9ERIC|nr:hypothetical protein Vadar_014822 [Vaccinium darrowii]